MINPPPLMSAHEQAIRLLECSSLNLDYQAKFNNYSEVIDITCKPRFGHDYLAPRSVIKSTVNIGVGGTGIDLNKIENEGLKK